MRYLLIFSFISVYLIFTSNAYAINRSYCDENATYSGDHLCSASTVNEFIDQQESCEQREIYCRRGAGGTASGDVVINEWFLIEDEHLLYPTVFTRNQIIHCLKILGSFTGTDVQRCQAYAQRHTLLFKLRIQCTFNHNGNPDAAACDY